MIFPASKRLIEIVEGLGWRLFHVPTDGAPPAWEDITPFAADEFEVGHNYLFAPIPEEGQTQREAYAMTKGLGPSLVLDPSWAGPDDFYKGASPIERENEILFTRLWFARKNYAVAISAKTRNVPDPSCARIGMAKLIETFEKYFRIVTPEEYGLEAPIPMPFYPEDN